jgi:hypothetical protein
MLAALSVIRHQFVSCQFSVISFQLSAVSFQRKTGAPVVFRARKSQEPPLKTKGLSASFWRVVSDARGARAEN